MRVNKTALHSALHILSAVADQKAHMPVLRCVKLDAKAGVLTLTATDLNKTLVTNIPCEGDIATVLPCKLLTQLVKPESKKDNGVVVMEPCESAVSVQVDGLATKLTGIPVDEFPQGSEHDWNLIGMWDAKLLADSLAYVNTAVSKDTTRAHLCCVAFTDDKIVTTDGHRLHLARLPAPVEAPLLIPTDAAGLLQRILKDGQVIVVRAGEHLKIRSGSYELTTKLVDATFPPWEQVVPRNHPTCLAVDSKAFATALKKVGAVSNGNGVRMTVNGTITLSSSDPAAGESRIEIAPIENTHTGADIVMGFNRAFLLDAIGKGKETVRLSMAGCLDPLRIDLEDGRTSVVMPMRV